MGVQAWHDEGRYPSYLMKLMERPAFQQADENVYAPVAAIG